MSINQVSWGGKYDLYSLSYPPNKPGGYAHALVLVKWKVLGYPEPTMKFIDEVLSEAFHENKISEEVAEEVSRWFNRNRRRLGIIDEPNRFYEHNLAVISTMMVPQFQEGFHKQYKEARQLGGGYYGEAYQVSPKRAVKFTTDSGEAQAVYKLIEAGFSHPNLVKYYSIQEIPNKYSLAGRGDYWVIKMEKAQGYELDEEAEKVLDDLGNFIHLNKRHLRKGKRLEIPDYWSVHAGTELYELYVLFLRQIESLVIALSKVFRHDDDYNLDIHAGNVVVDRFGNLKFFDVVRDYSDGEPEYKQLVLR